MSKASSIDSCELCAGSKKRFQSDIYRCENCGLFFSHLTPGFGNPIKGMNSITIENYKIVKNAIENVTDLRGKSILDVGCAEGGFTELMRDCDADTIAIEPDLSAAEPGISAGLPIRLIDYNSFIVNETDKFDIIVFNDVFEHMPDPNDIIKKCKSRLNGKGLVVLNLPISNGPVFNISAILAKLGIRGPFERIWAKKLPSPHIYFFSKKNIEFLLNNNNIKIIDQGKLVAVATDGMYERVRSTFGPIQSLIITCLALLYVFFSRVFGPDVMYFIGEKIE